MTDFRGPTAERLIHSDGYVETGDNKQGTRVYHMLDTVLDRTYADLQSKAGTGDRDLLRREYAALKRFHGHFEEGGLMGSVCSVDLNRSGGDAPSHSHLAKTERQVAARQAYVVALSVMSPHQRIVATLVVCEDISLELAGYKIGKKSKTRAFEMARNVLRTAAESLADHWGMR
jgi:hypothetical protein